MITGSIHQEDIMILNSDAPNHSVSKYVKQKLIEMKGETCKPHRVGISTLHSQQLMELLGLKSARV